jgi:outer membrane protein assembly factor BamB
VESVPAVAYGYVYIGSEDGKVYAYPERCSRTCQPAWTFATGDAIAGQSAAVANGVVYIGSNDGMVYALDALSGAELWSYLTGDVIDDAPAVVDGTLYVGSFDHNLYAFALPG